MRKLLLITAATIALTGVALADNEERWLIVHNEGSESICNIYINHVGTASWGRDLIRGRCLKPNRYRTVDPGWRSGYCKMDMRFVFKDGEEVYEDDYNICEETDYYVYHPDDGD